MAVQLVLVMILVVEFSEAILPCLLPSSLQLAARQPSVVSWEGGSLSFADPTLGRMFTESGFYKSKNMVATKALNKYDTTFLLMPRYKKGNPSTIVTYDAKLRLSEPRLTPFPDLSSHEEGDCSAIQNAVDFYADHLGFLWVLDLGVVNTLTKPKVMCSPKVVQISITSRMIINTIDLKSLTRENSQVQSIAVDYDNDNRAYIYITDGPAGAILVYNVEKARGFRVQIPADMASTDQRQDVLYMALTHHQGSCSATLYLTYCTSPHIYSIDTEYLRKGKAQGQIHDVCVKVAPMVFIGTNLNTIYFKYRNQPEVYSWDTSTAFDPESLKPIYISDEGFVATSVFLDSRRGLKVLESNFQEYVDNRCGCGAIQQIVDLR